LDSTTRLRIATRIHHSLQRHLGETVAVHALLDSDAEGREALWVCESSEDRELVDLAKQFKRANRPEAAMAAAAAPAAAGRVRQETTWAQNTTGFGLSQPAELAPARDAIEPGAHWLHPASWFGALRTQR
jgi:hypothetical protein